MTDVNRKELYLTHHLQHIDSYQEQQQEKEC